jgi:transposase
MRRRVTRVPNTAQRSLGFGEQAEGAREAARPKKVRFGATEFLDPTPWHLYIGQERVDEYLKKRGLGWVVQMREELQKVDWSSLELNYLGMGRPAYHPRLMMGLIVYAVLKQRWSLRAIEELAVADVGAWWLCAGQQPDHSTIGEFLIRHRLEIPKEFFEALVRGLVKRQGIKNGVVAGDGTVIEAAASRFELLSQEAAEQAAGKAKDAAEHHPHDAGLEQQAKQAEAVACVARQRAAERVRKGRKATQDAPLVTPIEPQAVVQRCKDGRHRPSYKPSVLVHESGLIVSQVVEPSSEGAAMPELLDQYQHAFGADPLSLLLDAGYHSIEVLAPIAARQIDVLCPSGTTLNGQWERKGNKEKFGKNKFTLDPEGDHYLCPAGHWLTPGKVYKDVATGLNARKYRTTQCSGCELRAKCTQNKQGREIVRFEGEEIKAMMEEVLAQSRARCRYRRRREIVERIFAEFGWRQGLHRFHRRALDGSKLEFGLHCIALNLKWAIRRDPSSSTFGPQRDPWRGWIVFIIWARDLIIPTPNHSAEDILLPIAA